MNHHQPLRVTASLEGGLATAGTWGIALDGLLASLLHAQAKASGDDISGPVLDDPDPADLDLPLARCHSDPWHWASTCAWPVDGADRMPGGEVVVGAHGPRGARAARRSPPPEPACQRRPLPVAVVYPD